MTLDVFDRAQAREAQDRDDALRAQERRAVATLGRPGDAERWRELSAEFCEGTGCGAPIPEPVSYTHLDVYKRQDAGWVPRLSQVGSGTGFSQWSITVRDFRPAWSRPTASTRANPMKARCLGCPK